MLWPLCSPQNRCRLFVGVLVSFVVCLGSDSAHAQDTTATAQPLVVLSPLAQAALYKPTPSPRYQSPACRPNTRFTSRERCIAKGLFHTVMGTLATTLGATLYIFALTSENPDPLAITMISIIAAPALLGGIVSIIYGAKLIKRGKKLPPGGPPLHPDPFRF